MGNNPLPPAKNLSVIVFFSCTRVCVLKRGVSRLAFMRDTKLSPRMIGPAPDVFAFLRLSWSELSPLSLLLAAQLPGDERSPNTYPISVCRLYLFARFLFSFRVCVPGGGAGGRGFHPFHCCLFSDLQGGQVRVQERADDGLPQEALPRHVLPHPPGKFPSVCVRRPPRSVAVASEKKRKIIPGEQIGMQEKEKEENRQQ